MSFCGIAKCALGSIVPLLMFFVVAAQLVQAAVPYDAIYVRAPRFGDNEGILRQSLSSNTRRIEIELPAGPGNRFVKVRRN